MMMKEKIWNSDYELQKTEDATKLEQSALDKNSAVAISLLVNWDDKDNNLHDFVLPEDGQILSGYEDYERNKERPWDAKFSNQANKWTKLAKIFFIEIKD